MELPFLKLTLQIYTKIMDIMCVVGQELLTYFYINQKIQNTWDQIIFFSKTFDEINSWAIYKNIATMRVSIFIYLP